MALSWGHSRATQRLLTWGIIDELESDLKRTHDAVGIKLIVHLVHGESIPVLDGAVTKGKAEDLAKLHRLDVYDDFG